MGSIIEYVKTEMRTFTEEPFSAVDSLVLSQIAYFKLSGLVPGLYDDEAVRASSGSVSGGVF